MELEKVKGKREGGNEEVEGGAETRRKVKHEMLRGNMKREFVHSAATKDLPFWGVAIFVCPRARMPPPPP